MLSIRYKHARNSKIKGQQASCSCIAARRLVIDLQGVATAQVTAYVKNNQPGRLAVNHLYFNRSRSMQQHPSLVQAKPHVTVCFTHSCCSDCLSVFNYESAHRSLYRQSTPASILASPPSAYATTRSVAAPTRYINTRHTLDTTNLTIISTLDYLFLFAGFMEWVAGGREEDRDQSYGFSNFPNFIQKPSYETGLKEPVKGELWDFNFDTDILRIICCIRKTILGRVIVIVTALLMHC